MKLFAGIYCLVCYAIGVSALVYLILFIADLYVPTSVNTASPYAPELSGVMALAWNLGLIALWGLQHSVMASPGWKQKWTLIIPASIERSTYLVAVAAMTAVVALAWVPMPGTFWDLSGTTAGSVVLGIYFLGWVITLIATFLINHFHLFGLQQAWQLVREVPSKEESFRTPLFYKLVRHPMMTGVLIALWAAPTMTTGRLVFSIGMTAYVFIGIHYEEKTLRAELGEAYDEYRKTTPSVIPGLKR